ncbi:hypothetical protein CDL15_Pgr026987 [Punica granatum]|uniref:Uncharacterized protein n=1 Tax=Punica granatum TaxID=22663 RepID=A0A218W7D5_PUNGR|nr:hypothetical protein CDL15_Pgr026987 [Punica granatum]
MFRTGWGQEDGEVAVKVKEPVMGLRGKRATAEKKLKKKGWAFRAELVACLSFQPRRSRRREGDDQ